MSMDYEDFRDWLLDWLNRGAIIPSYQASELPALRDIPEHVVGHWILRKDEV